FVLGREFSIVWEKMTRGEVRDLESNAHTNANIPRTHHSQHRKNTSSSDRTDLTNKKLAKNQVELSRQIEELMVVVEKQGLLLERLVVLL
ncbi:hypothetical protein BDN72DRAFT_733039, partial [Pluteus cervinus]